MEDEVQTVATDYFLRGLDEQRKDDTLTDITRRVDGRDFQAHKSVLAAAYEYFKIMFGGNFKEHNAPVLRLDDTPVRTESLEVILDGIYCGELKPTTALPNIAASIDFLRIPVLFPALEQFMIPRLSANTWSEYFEIATKFQLRETEAAVRSFIARNCTSFYRRNEIDRLGYEELLGILGERDPLNEENYELVTVPCIWREDSGDCNQKIDAVSENPGNVPFRDGE